MCFTSIAQFIYCNSLFSYLAGLLCFCTSGDILYVIDVVIILLPVTESLLSILAESKLENQVITKWFTIYWTIICIVFRLDTHMSTSRSDLSSGLHGYVWVCVQTVLDWCLWHLGLFYNYWTHNKQFLPLFHKYSMYNGIYKCINITLHVQYLLWTYAIFVYN